MTIVPPEKFAYSSYVVNRDLCDFSAIGFFEFEKFPSRRQHFASIAWKEIIMLVKKQNPKGAKMLIHEWNTTRDVRKSYWKDKEENEKKIEHLTALEEHARKQTLDAARKVDHDTEILVDDIIIEKATGKVQRPSTRPTSAPTRVPRAVGNMGKRWQQNDVESSSSRRLHPKSTHGNEFEGVQERIGAQQENSLGSPKHSALRNNSEEATPMSLHSTSKASDRRRVEDDDEYGIPHDDVNDGDDTDANDQGDDYEDIIDDEMNDLQMVEATSPFDDLVAELFRKLAKWEELPEVEKKSTMVALSGILNTMDNEMEDFEDMETVRTACYDESFSIPSKEMQSLLNEFVEAMGPSRDLWQLKIFCRREQLQAMENRRENSERTKYVNVVEYL
ncbi:hypothetical protein BGX21_000321 [Mortierella sp. AD011]|nr:hypothetical protein BGX20_000181 [Mortierella sp. AD010]KAF9388416.1 hypothetical protein BGX21_000321 [Mortierella sp. AD011]